MLPALKTMTATARTESASTSGSAYIRQSPGAQSSRVYRSFNQRVFFDLFIGNQFVAGASLGKIIVSPWGMDSSVLIG